MTSFFLAPWAFFFPDKIWGSFWSSCMCLWISCGSLLRTLLPCALWCMHAHDPPNPPTRHPQNFSFSLFHFTDLSQARPSLSQWEWSSPGYCAQLFFSIICTFLQHTLTCLLFPYPHSCIKPGFALFGSMEWSLPLPACHLGGYCQPCVSFPSHSRSPLLWPAYG